MTFQKSLPAPEKFSAQMMRPMKPKVKAPTCLVSCAWLTASVVVIHAADLNAHERNWPAWRGPTGNGLVLHGNPPLEWNEEKNVKWKVKLPGSGHATPIIWENRVFILTAVPATRFHGSLPRPADGNHAMGESAPQGSASPGGPVLEYVQLSVAGHGW
jgi:hypothetical protein